MFFSTIALLLLLVLLLNNDNVRPALGVPQITATAPINPVDKGGVFAVHCHIQDLESGHEVSIFRTTASDPYELLSVNSHVQPGVADTVFLAERQLPDSSKVFFMTIAEVGKNDDDEGRYSCRVTLPPSVNVIAEEHIDMRVSYFPSDTSPRCEQPKSMVLMEGVAATFNCSSEIGNPPVSIVWKQTGSDRTLKSSRVVEGNTVYSVLTFTPRVQDNQAVLLCEISSKAFPRSEGYRNCHIGPLTVQRNPNLQTWYNPTNLITTVQVVTNIDRPVVSGKKNSTTECSKVCSKFNSPVSYWITATIFLTVVAFIFFAVAIALSIKYCNAVDDTSTEHYIGPYATRHIELPSDINDKVYVEVEHKRDNGRLYMSLQRPVNNNQCPK